MKTRKFILLNLFIFILSIIACSTTKGTAFRSILLLDKRFPSAFQAEVTQGKPPGYTAMFKEGSTPNQSGVTLGRPPGYTTLLKDPPNVNALVTVLPVRTASAFTPETFPVKVNSEDSLLDSAVQIILVPADPAEKTVTGIGTLVAHDGVVYLFTHNHWDSIEDRDTVYFRNAKGEPLMELYGREIDRLVVYRDEGNLVLRSPLPKKVPAARFGEMGTIKPGDIVTIAYRKGEDGKTIGLQAGFVKKAGERNGVPVYQLTVINGETVGPCDCGAGVWHDGGFIGTVWQVQLDNHQSAQIRAPLRSVQELNAAQALFDMVHLRKC